MNELPITSRGCVYPWQCDHIGHMNVTYYVAKFDEATWNLFAMIGITPSYLRDSGCGMAAVQQNFTYRRELLAGDIVTVRTRVVEVRDKVLRFDHQMVNGETGEVAAIAEMTGVHIDTTARKSRPFPEAILATARALAAAHDGGP